MNSKQYMIRVAQPEDMATVTALMAPLWPELNAQQVEQMAQTLLNLPDGEVFLAQVQDQAVAMAQCSIPATKPGEQRIACLDGIYILPQWRLRGIGRSLAEACEKWGMDAGCETLSLACQPGKLQGLGFHFVAWSQKKRSSDTENTCPVAEQPPSAGIARSGAGDVLSAMVSRRSYRGAFKNQAVPREDLRRIMEAGLAAPSGCNKQTTSLIAIDDPVLLEQINALLKKTWAQGATAGICVLTQKTIAYGERSFYIQDYAAAVQNMLVALHAMGYASCWLEGYLSGPDQYGQAIARHLNIPPQYELVVYLPIGWPQDEVAAPGKAPFEQRACFNKCHFTGKDA